MKDKTLGAVALVVAMFSAAPVSAVLLADAPPPASRSGGAGGAGASVLDLFELSPERFVNAMNADGE